MEDVRNIVVVRPGALGDVLTTRGVLRFLRLTFPGARLRLLAPGERGRLFDHFGWVDEVLDWESAECGWLFSSGEAEPGARLRAAFDDVGLVISFVGDTRGNVDDNYKRRVAELAPHGAHGCFPARPDESGTTPIGRWLLDCAQEFCRERRLVRGDAFPDLAACHAARFRVDGAATAERLLVMHPGSGGRRKNWPVENFAVLANALLAAKGGGGERLFSRLVATSGEADATLGEQLCAMVPGASIWPQGGLERLAGLLAGARLYVGNDSGVSHLAASVMGDGGTGPAVAVVFGPSNAGIWAPPDALVLDAGEAMDSLDTDDALHRVLGLFQ